MTFFDWKFYVENYKLDINNKEDAYNNWEINQYRYINRYYTFKNKIDYIFCIYYYNINSTSLSNSQLYSADEILRYIDNLVKLNNIKSIFDLKQYDKKINYDFDRWEEYIEYLNILVINSTLNRNILGYTIESGISIFTVCMDRNENLQISIQNWLQIDDIDEIIILDWNSKIPISESCNIINNKIKIITIKDINEWVLTKSFNLASKYTRYNKICKLDCDYILNKNFFKEHKLTNNIFYSSNHNKLPSKYKISLSGFLYINRYDFMKINGYDERITTYGWDDDDIKNRLIKNNIKEVQINLDLIDHITHNENCRIKNQKVLDIRISTHTNRFMISKYLNNWSILNKGCLWYPKDIKNNNCIFSLYTDSESSISKHQYKICQGLASHYIIKKVFNINLPILKDDEDAIKYIKYYIEYDISNYYKYKLKNNLNHFEIYFFNEYSNENNLINSKNIIDRIYNIKKTEYIRKKIYFFQNLVWFTQMKYIINAQLLKYNKMKDTKETVFVWSYKNPKYSDIAQLWNYRIDKNLPIYNVERGALPDTIFIDSTGFLLESTLYDEIYWNIDLSDDKIIKIDTYINLLINDKNKSLEKQNQDEIQSIFKIYTKKYDQIIFIPLQLQEDTVIKFGSDWVNNIENFIQIILSIASNNMNILFMMKNHPLTNNKFSSDLDNICIVDTYHYKDCLSICHKVITINSGVGLQSMCWLKPCIICGKAFYNFNDINYKANNLQELITLIKQKKLYIDEIKVKKFIYYLKFIFYSDVELFKTSIDNNRNSTSFCLYKNLRIL